MAPSTSASFASFEKLTPTGDFGLWKLRMHALLTREGSIQAIHGKDSVAGDQAKKDLIDGQAFSTLVLGLNDDVLRSVSDQTTAQAIWTKLGELFLKSTLSNRFCYKQRLFTFKMEEGTSMQDHINAFKKVITDLKNLNLEVDDEDAAFILLCSLPKAYESLTNTILYGRKDLTLQEAISVLLSDDQRQRAQGQIPEASQIAVAREGARAKVKCYYCQREGHIKRNCRKFKEDMKKNKAGGDEPSIGLVVEEDFL